MATTLIETDDGLLIEVEVPGEQIQPVSGGAASRVNAVLGSITPILMKTITPISRAWNELNRDMTIEKAEIELGLGFEIEGNVYLAKSKASSNLTVKLTLKPRE